MRFLLIGILGLGLPCLAYAGPEAAEKAASADHANDMANAVELNQKAKLKTVKPGAARVVLVKNDTVNPGARLLSKRKQRLTVKHKKSSTLIHISNPR